MIAFRGATAHLKRGAGVFDLPPPINLQEPVTFSVCLQKLGAGTSGVARGGRGARPPGASLGGGGRRPSFSAVARYRFFLCFFHSFIYTGRIFGTYMGSIPGRQKPRRTKSHGDKRPGGQNPSETKAQGDKSPGGQNPTGTKPHGGQYPSGQYPRGTKSQDVPKNDAFVY